jgi:outer membrane PBP1 activator LpoA protein
MYALALAIESEARQLARHARDTGAATVAVVSSDAPLQKRFAAAFIDAWLLLGGAAPVSLHFDRAPEMLALLRREMGRTPVDAVLIAVDGADASLVKPYIGATATYAGSQVNDRQSREALRDLDAVRFVEIPWLADPDSSEFANIPRPDFPNTSFDRLYALGLDAFHVAQDLADGRAESLDFDGATGRLTLERSRQFAREGRLLQFRAGQITPYAAR